MWGGGDKFADVAVGDEPCDERVLARAAAENKNPHRVSKLRLGSISLTLTGFAPRIRRCVC